MMLGKPDADAASTVLTLPPACATLCAAELDPVEASRIVPDHVGAMMCDFYFAADTVRISDVLIETEAGELRPHSIRPLDNDLWLVDVSIIHKAMTASDLSPDPISVPMQIFRRLESRN
jgi:hypothetical protein